MEAKIPPNLQLGADPEFEVYDLDGKFVNALDALWEYRIQNSRMTTYVDYERSEVGLDGFSMIGELRPDPAKEWETVYSNIKRLITVCMPIYFPKDKYRIYAGSGKTYPCGGHIHISGIDATDFLIRLLDEWITLPLNNISNICVRSVTPYGKTGQIKWRDEGHWEYRSPLSWIINPIVVKGVLCITHVLTRIGVGERIESAIDVLRFTLPIEKIILLDYWKHLEAMRTFGHTLESVELYKAWGV